MTDACPTVGDILRDLYGLGRLISPFIANALVVFRRSPAVEWGARRALPICVGIDGVLCRLPQSRRWASLGMDALRCKSE